MGKDALSNPAFLSKIKIPDQMDLDMGGSTQHEMSVFGGVCQVQYDVGAHLKTCNGLKEMKLMVKDEISVDRSNNGKMTVVVPMEISAGLVSCMATAFARGAACGLAVDVGANARPSFSVNDVSIRVLMKVVEKGWIGKTCLQPSRVEVTSAGKLVWGDLPISLFYGKDAEVPFTKQDVPDSVFNAVWEQATSEAKEAAMKTRMMGGLVDQLSSSLGLKLDDVTGALNDLLRSSLESQLLAMSHCF